jgi:hypothetical protein
MNERTVNQAQVDGSGNIIIQGIDGSTIIINPNNSDQIRKLVMDLGTKLSELPTEILSMIEKKQDISATINAGANIYLTILTELHQNRSYNRLKFGLTITNLTKENRYFNQPFFKVTPMATLEKGVEHDTFIMIPEEGNIFPRRLEYGEPLSVRYEIKPGAYQMYQTVVDKDKDGFIQVFTNTTVGELYESNKLTIKSLFETLNWIRK